MTVSAVTHLQMTVCVRKHEVVNIKTVSLSRNKENSCNQVRSHGIVFKSFYIYSCGRIKYNFMQFTTKIGYIVIVRKR